MKKLICIICSIILTALAFSGCGVSISDNIDDAVGGLEQDYSRYIEDHGLDDLPESVADVLNDMLDNFVSGLSNPLISEIDDEVIDPDDSPDDAQEIIDSVTDTPANEKELQALLFDAIHSADTELSFSITGGWLTGELLYEIVFTRIHDVYMLDALGLYGYRYTETTVGGTTSYRMEFIYIDDSTPEQILAMREDVDAKSKEIIRDLGLSSKSDYEKIRAINDYLCETVYYPPEPYVENDHTPYGAMIIGRSVCEGYARATKLLCDLCGIDSYYVVGVCTNGVRHGWNLVKIDGMWYQLDVTWNDGSSTDDYFLVTDSFMSYSRSWDRSAYPASSATPYS